ncbi:unnamed protein product [Rangifer tarandus platyrhynchus]|uniref:Interleukin-2 receptor subunit beta n=1 Tax=Rangifer tarandus platyrhynchus TaxID=3082113 RepID=A0ABN8YZM1_RANTA|nr:unnamed protein product [Rangifer tarandus platyrhynchus]
MAAPALPCCLSLLILLLPLAIPQASTSVNASPTSHIFTAFASNITCFYNSRANVSCIWSHDEGLQATTCCLHSHQPKRCQVQRWRWELGSAFSSQHQHVASPKLVLSAFVSLLSPVRLVPPHSLQVAHVETHRCNITWTISQVSHYIQNDMEFEARLRYADHSWEDTPLLTLRQNQRWIYLENLAPGMEYELQVRAKPQLGRHGVWSHWSQPLAFRTVPAAFYYLGRGSRSPALGRWLRSQQRREAERARRSSMSQPVIMTTVITTTVTVTITINSIIITIAIVIILF